MLLTFMPSAAMAESAYFYSKLDLPFYSYLGQTQHPKQIDKLYIGSARSYAAEPIEVVIIGKSFNTGLAAAGAIKASDPLSTAAFLLIGLINAHDLSRSLKQKDRPASDWSFIWSRGK